MGVFAHCSIPTRSVSEEEPARQASNCNFLAHASGWDVGALPKKDNTVCEEARHVSNRHNRTNISFTGRLSHREKILYFLVIYDLKQPLHASPILIPPVMAAVQHVLDIGQLDEAVLDAHLLDAIPEASPKRRREFAAGRICAERCLEDQWHYRAEIGIGPDRSPIWPNGFVGSISHSNEIAWAVVAPKEQVRGIGIDCEQIVDEQTAEETCDQVASSDELASLLLAGLTLEEAFTLTFSIKEAIYKCLYPLGIKSLQFRDIQVSDATDAQVHVRLPQTCASFGTFLRSQFAFDRDHVFTMCTLRA